MNPFFEGALPFKHPSTTPKALGVYVRDWRGTAIMPRSDRNFSFDLFVPVPRGEELAPGVWYVLPNWNDASEQALPWRPMSPGESVAFTLFNPEALHAAGL